MKIEVQHHCSDFNSYRAARVKSLFNAEKGCDWEKTIELPIEDREWQIGLVVGPSGSGKPVLEVRFSKNLFMIFIPAGIRINLLWIVLLLMETSTL